MAKACREFDKFHRLRGLQFAIQAIRIFLLLFNLTFLQIYNNRQFYSEIIGLSVNVVRHIIISYMPSGCIWRQIY